MVTRAPSTCSNGTGPEATRPARRAVGSASRLRIAQIAPLSLRIPPLSYGGTERVVHALTEGLLHRGHDVTLFAAGTSLTSARLRSATPRPLWEVDEDSHPEVRARQIADLVAHQHEFDIIHSHVDYVSDADAELEVPTVRTLHGRLDLPREKQLLLVVPDQPLVSISNRQRAPVADLGLNWQATIYHGLRLTTTYRLGEGDGGYLAFLGRINPEKDPVTAIRVAVTAGLPIKIAARVDPIDREYHRDQVMPWLDHPLVHWVGEVDDRGKAELLEHALALLVPIDWEEPFGLVFIESLAAGTPVISRPRGALPELVDNGRNGFLAEDEDGLVAACKAVAALDRRACRAMALDRFSVEQMALRYEEVYTAVLEARADRSSGRSCGSNGTESSRRRQLALSGVEYGAVTDD
ncbi:MAG: glycosyltransferase family 4 protein [Candidatus Dormibacteria bacterium]